MSCPIIDEQDVRIEITKIWQALADSRTHTAIYGLAQETVSLRRQIDDLKDELVKSRMRECADVTLADGRVLRFMTPENRAKLKVVTADRDLAHHLLAIVRAELVVAESALEMLVDEQNGPPLLAHEDAWQEAMDHARAVLKREPVDQRELKRTPWQFAKADKEKP